MRSTSKVTKKAKIAPSVRTLSRQLKAADDRIAHLDEIISGKNDEIHRLYVVRELDYARKMTDRHRKNVGLECAAYRSLLVEYLASVFPKADRHAVERFNRKIIDRLCYWYNRPTATDTHDDSDEG